MKRNFKLILEYDGTRFHGWQRQPKDITIQAAIEEALFRITQQHCTLYGSGRTDAGVHALNYAANFRCETRLEPPVLVRALNSLLPGDIVIKECTLAPEDFHARKSALSKVYQYHIANGPAPPAIGRQYAWHMRGKLDGQAMDQAASYFLGTHDFSAFEGVGSPKATSVRTIMQSRVDSCQDHLIYTVEANGFLRYMVRNIVGALVLVGAGKLQPRDMTAILESGDRGKAGPTAPPQGLFLTAVKY